MFENIKNIFKRSKKRELLKSSSKDTAKERLHLVLMQDRANVSADFLDLMRQEIVEVIKKYIDDEKSNFVFTAGFICKYTDYKHKRWDKANE